MEKKLIIAARTLSLVFKPFYLPLVGMTLLFWASYLSMLSARYKFTVMLLVYVFTILLPTLTIRFYTNYHGWKLFQLGKKERRMVPYIVSIVCYYACYYIMAMMRIPHFVGLILVVAINLQIVCAFINVWWKVSTHAAAVGAVTGFLVVYSLIFDFYLLWWLSLTLVVSGCVCSARLILRQHSLGQVLGGYALGLLLSVVVIVYI